jgi:hypothetical protein
MEIVTPVARPGATEGLGRRRARPLSRAARHSGREKGDGLSKARRLRLLIGTFLLALSVILTGCSGSGNQERKEDYEKMKMLKKQEEKEKEKKKEK